MVEETDIVENSYVCVLLDCIILDIISNVKMHMLVFFCGFLNPVKYLLNRWLLCIIYAMMGPMVEDNSSIVAVLSVVTFQLNNGLFNKLVLSSLLRTSPWGVPETPWAWGTQGDTWDLWCYWWEGPSDPSVGEGLGRWERLPPTETSRHEGKAISYA